MRIIDNGGEKRRRRSCAQEYMEKQYIYIYIYIKRERERVLNCEEIRFLIILGII